MKYPPRHPLPNLVLGAIEIDQLLQALCKDIGICSIRRERLVGTLPCNIEELAIAILEEEGLGGVLAPRHLIRQVRACIERVLDRSRGSAAGRGKD